MVLKITAPYGDWESELSAEAVTRGSRELASPRVDPNSGRAFFLESRPDGTNGILEVAADEIKPVLPETSSAGTSVYEYGGLSYALVPGERLRIIFSDALTKSVGLLDVDSGRVTALRPQSATLRYADFDAHAHLPWVVAVEEDHACPRAAEVRNHVVAINVDSGEIRRAVTGADFYSYPRFSPDGRKVAWKQWDHPDLPFRGAKVFWADWSAAGEVENVELVAGAAGECPTEPRWNPDGRLFFAQERGHFRQLFWKRPGEEDVHEVVLPGLEEAEIGDSSFVIGCQTYVFLTPTTLVAAPSWCGAYDLVHIDLSSSTCTRLRTPLTDLRFDCLAPASPTSVLAVGSGCTDMRAVHLVTLQPTAPPTASTTPLRPSASHPFPARVFSAPRPLHIPTIGGRLVHGFLWLPHNPRFAAPAGTRPPLIVTPHGGPTGHWTPGLRPREQYFVSRGFALLAVNYAGSSGHGRAYREALYGEWGVRDRDDVADAVRYLAREGVVDGERVGIVGASAGGYVTLLGLCSDPGLYAGGVSYCGVADLAGLDSGTHKLESRYTEALLGTAGMARAEKDRLYRERSPVHHTENIRAPLLLIHGEDDPVVPVGQSREMESLIRDRGGDARLVTFPGEGHMFKYPQSWCTSVLEEERWWRKTLLRRE